MATPDINSTASGGFPLKPWPTAGNRKPKTLAEFIARVNIERGGFRNISTEGLLEEMRLEKERAAAGDDDDVAMDVDDDSDSTISGDEPGDDDDDDDEMDVYEAKGRILQILDTAHNTAMMTLDLVSLLLSKEAPALAAQTLSPMLRDLVGIGTLGAGKLSLPSDSSNGYSMHPNPARINNPAKAADDEAIAVGWTILDIDKIRTTASSVARKLAVEASREARYWSDLKRVRDAGWSVCRLPNDRKMLGVQCGFGGTSAEFRGSSVAAMRRDEDDGGAAVLDTGSLEGGSQRLVVTVERDGKVTGRSGSVALPPDHLPLEARVLEARNTIFAQELWHELRLESRDLFANGVWREGDGVRFKMGDGVLIRLDLVAAGREEEDDVATQQQDSEAATSTADDFLADSAHLALHVLLSHVHRAAEMQRLKPRPPHHARSAPVSRQIYTLVKPILEYVAHRDYATKLLGHVGDMVAMLHAAGLKDAFFKLSTPPLVSIPDLVAAAAQHTGAPQALVQQLLSVRMLQLDIAITPTARVAIQVITTLNPITTTAYVAPGGGGGGGGGGGDAHWLMRLCPPPRDGFMFLHALQEYLLLVTERAIVEHSLDTIHRAIASAGAGPIWIKGITGSSLCEFIANASGQHAAPGREISFKVIDGDQAGSGGGDSSSKDTPAAPDAGESLQGTRLVVVGRWREQGRARRMRALWAPRGASCAQTLDDVVGAMCRPLPPTPAQGL